MTTFGIELECILIFPHDSLDEYTRSQSLDYREGWNAMAIRIVHGVLAKSFEAECPRPDCSEQHEYHIPVHTPDVRGIYGSYSHWAVSLDSSVALTHDEEDRLPQSHVIAGLEIKSRVLNFGGTSCPEGQSDHHGGTMKFSWHWEVFHTLRLLHEHFSNTANQRLVINGKCGFHVHIGNGVRGFPAQTVQSMMALFTAFERQFDSITSTSRIGGCTVPMNQPKYEGRRKYDYISENEFESVNEESGGFCRPMSGIHFATAVGELGSSLEDATEVQSQVFPNRLKAVNPRLASSLRDINVLAWLYTIMSTTSICDSKDYCEVQPGHTSSLNLDGVSDDPSMDQLRQTVEFRSHAGTLDPAEICAWVDFLGCMARWCTNTSCSDVAKVVLKKWATCHFSFIDLAKLVGVSKRTWTHIDKRQCENYAVKRWKKAKKLEESLDDDISQRKLIELIEQTRMQQEKKSHVKEKIRHKLEDCLYGVYPKTLGYFVLGPFKACSKDAQPLFSRSEEWYQPVREIAEANDR